MKAKWICIVVVVFFTALGVFAVLPEQNEKVSQTQTRITPQDVDSVTWMIEQNLEVPVAPVPGVEVGMTHHTFGSGFCIMNGDTPVIWTAAHVLGFYGIKKDGVERFEFGKVEVVRDIIKDGEYQGEHRVPAKVIRCDHHQDIAILILPPQHFPSAKMASIKPEKVGAKLWHVGSMLGELGRNSFSELNVAALGRLRTDGERDVYNGLLYDQVTGTMNHGSSGGGLFRTASVGTTPEAVGIVVEFLGENSWGSFCYIPTRRLREFAFKSGVLWAIGPECGPVPKDVIFKK